MASVAQITANRVNAKNSTGPVTEEGKLRAARNSTSHGLTSKDVSIPAGLAAEFEALRAGLQTDLNPETPIQVVFFNQALSAAWLQFRCDRAEAELDSRVSEPGLDPLLDPNLEPTIRTIHRTRAQAVKHLSKAIAELRKVQTEQQYRWAAMPEDEGYVIAGLGLACWKTINEKMKNEAKARLEIMLNAQPMPSPIPVPSAPAAERRKYVDSPFLTVCLEELRRMNGNEKSNPIVLSPAA
ncbi:MAG: hypothetical protein ABI693_02010 [Bryobacteraceae bacterium]